MKVVQLHIDGKSYFLNPDHDVRALQQEMIAAASGTPAFITFHPVGNIEVAALMSPHTALRFEVWHRPDSSAEGDDEPMSDVDQYGFIDAL